MDTDLVQEKWHHLEEWTQRVQSAIQQLFQERTPTLLMLENLQKDITDVGQTLNATCTVIQNWIPLLNGLQEETKSLQGIRGGLDFLKEKVAQLFALHDAQSHSEGEESKNLQHQLNTLQRLLNQWVKHWEKETTIQQNRDTKMHTLEQQVAHLLGKHQDTELEIFSLKTIVQNQSAELVNLRTLVQCQPENPLNNTFIAGQQADVQGLLTRETGLVSQIGSLQAQCQELQTSVQTLAPSLMQTWGNLWNQEKTSFLQHIRHQLHSNTPPPTTINLTTPTSQSTELETLQKQVHDLQERLQQQQLPTPCNSPPPSVTLEDNQEARPTPSTGFQPPVKHANPDPRDSTRNNLKPEIQLDSTLEKLAQSQHRETHSHIIDPEVLALLLSSGGGALFHHPHNQHQQPVTVMHKFRPSQEQACRWDFLLASFTPSYLVSRAKGPPFHKNTKGVGQHSKRSGNNICK
jgi:hypothetical protein